MTTYVLCQWFDFYANRSGFSGADLRQLRCHSFTFQSGVVVCFGFGRRDVPDGFEQAEVVEPVDPFQRGVVHGLEAAPRAATVDDLCFKLGH